MALRRSAQPSDPGLVSLEPSEDVRPVSPPNAVEVRGVTMAFGEEAVLDGIDLTIPRGQIFGLLGPSGCGKTTLVRLLVGIGQASEGEIRVAGKAPRDFTSNDRRLIGYTPQAFHLYPTLTVYQNAQFVTKLYGLGWSTRRRRIREVLQFLELWDARGTRAKDISGGMQRRLVLAAALFHDPRILVVDEPTAGLDPILRTKIWDHLRRLRDFGVTVIVTTQYVEEAEYCDAVGILHKGELIAQGAPEELRKNAVGGEGLDIQAAKFERGDIAAIWQLPCVRAAHWISDDELRCTVDDIGDATVAITQALHDRGTEVTAVRPHVPSFDEAFLALVGDR